MLSVSDIHLPFLFLALIFFFKYHNHIHKKQTSVFLVLCPFYKTSKLMRICFGLKFDSFAKLKNINIVLKSCTSFPTVELIEDGQWCVSCSLQIPHPTMRDAWNRYVETGGFKRLSGSGKRRTTTAVDCFLVLATLRECRSTAVQLQQIRQIENTCRWTTVITTSSMGVTALSLDCTVMEQSSHHWRVMDLCPFSGWSRKGIEKTRGTFIHLSTVVLYRNSYWALCCGIWNFKVYENFLQQAVVPYFHFIGDGLLHR